MKNDTHFVIMSNNMFINNIAFCKIGELNSNKRYFVRARCIFKNSNIKSKYSKWINFETKEESSSDDYEIDKDDHDDNKKNDFIIHNPHVCIYIDLLFIICYILYICNNLKSLQQ